MLKEKPLELTHAKPEFLRKKIIMHSVEFFWTGFRVHQNREEQLETPSKVVMSIVGETSDKEEKFCIVATCLSHMYVVNTALQNGGGRM